MVRAYRIEASWPHPADADGAHRLAGRIAQTSSAARRLTGDPAGAAMIAAIGGNSPYLSDLAAREPRTLRAFAQFGPDHVMQAVMSRLAAADFTAPRAMVAQTIREAKRQAALTIALADIGGLWPLASVCKALSTLAGQCLKLCAAHLLRAAHDRHLLHLPDPRNPVQNSGFIILGMGKLGGHELNYSSDIDLVLLYDPDGFPAADRPELSGVFSRIARDLVTLMERRDADGYVFRTDLRLRPDPSATPPAVAVPAAITYYESMGQTWERAAMIKARPLAGDVTAGQRFLDQIKPFIWRRLLDFAAINDIAAMKRRIDLHKSTALKPGFDPVSRLLGHDVKLGEGGIREIEFIAQSLQLVWGGRDPFLRVRPTLEALAALTAAGRLDPGAAGRLSAAYEALRSVEHRLQMVQDRQTHSLPGNPADFAAFALFCGRNAMDFAQALLSHLRAVADIYDDFFARSEAADSLTIAASPGDEAETESALIRLGFSRPQAVIETIRGWRAGHLRALRSERARELLDRLLPRLLETLGRQPEPHLAFARLDRLFAVLPAGVQLLSLFERNPLLFERLATVLGSAPSLADHLAQVPSALEGLLVPDEPSAPSEARLAAELADARMLEDHIAILRRFVRGEEFRLSLAMVEGRIGVDEAGFARTAVADAAVRALLAGAESEHQSRFGLLPGGAFAVIALGKAGGREMLPGSDLDLMLVYDHAPEAIESNGPKPLAPAPYFTRLAHRFVAAITAPGAEGPLYAVDMRLRPSGRKGPVAVSLAALCTYHQGSAWVWERMALTRARIVAGPDALSRRLNAAIGTILHSAGDPEAIRREAAAMRGRIARDLPPASAWDVKLRTGGLVEVEFIAQVLQLIHPQAHAQNTCEALKNLASAGVLSLEDAALLMRADRAYRTVQGLLRLMAAKSEIPPQAMAALRRDLGADVENNLDRLAGAVRGIFLRLVGGT